MASESLWIGVSTLWVSTFLYGVYLILFVGCMRVLINRPNGRLSMFAVLPTTAVIMFMLSTASVLIFLLQGASAYGHAGISLDDLQIAGAVVYVTNNLVADALLVYRCYVIWGTIWVTVVPIILLLATMILGYSIQLRLFFIVSLSTNLLVPTLIATRLWWIIRRIRSEAGEATKRRGVKAIIIMLESGLIYSVLVSIHMAYFHYDNPIDSVIYAALGQIVGIVPTLIIVRVQQGGSQNGSMMSSASNPMGPNPDLHLQSGPDSDLLRRMESNRTLQNDRTVVADVTEEKGFRMDSETSGWEAETIV